MEKPAITHYPLHPLLAERWSPLAFTDHAVESEKLGSLLEAVRWAASSFNEQPWRLILATRDHPSQHAALLSCLAEGNISWAQKAPVLLITVTQLAFSHTGKPNRHSFHDVGLAIGNLTVQASALGLAVHQMAGFDPEKARELYGIPNGYEPVTAIALGYRAEPDTLPTQPLQQRELSPRTRKPLDTLIFSGHWGQAATLAQT